MYKYLAVLGLLALPINIAAAGQEMAAKGHGNDDSPAHQKITIRLKHSRAVEVVATFDNFLNQLCCVYPYGRASDGLTREGLKRDIILTADDKTNTLAISATPIYFGEILRMVEQLDQPPPQIMIQVVVAERDLKSGYIEILSRPQLLVLDRQTGLVNVGKNPHVSNLETLVQVTPAILRDGKVLLRVITEIAANVPSVSIGNAQADSLESTLTAHEGRTVVTKNMRVMERILYEKKIPWLGDLPLVSHMFRYRTPIVSQSELFVVLTPNIVHGREDADRVSREESDRIDCFMRQQTILFSR